MLTANYQFALFLSVVGFQLSFYSIIFYCYFFLKDKNILLLPVIMTPLLLLFSVSIYRLYDYRLAITITCVITYILLNISIFRINQIIDYNVIQEKFIWIGYQAYMVGATIVYCISQAHSYKTYSYAQLVKEWGVSLNKSAAGRYSTSFMNFQDLIIPVVVFAVIIIIAVCVEKLSSVPAIQSTIGSIAIPMNSTRSTFKQKISAFLNKIFIKNKSGVIIEIDKEDDLLELFLRTFKFGAKHPDINEITKFAIKHGEGIKKKWSKEMKK